MNITCIINIIIDQRHFGWQNHHINSTEHDKNLADC